MATKRMFLKSFVNRDSFLDLDLSAQALYFHLSLEADDDGFVESPRGIARKIGASKDDIQALADGHFIIEFESGVIVIRHWKLHNHIPSDRYNATLQQEEYKQLLLDENKTYNRKVETECKQDVSEMIPQTKYQSKYSDLDIDTEYKEDKDSPELEGNTHSVLPSTSGQESDPKRCSENYVTDPEAKRLAVVFIAGGFVYDGNGLGGLEGYLARQLHSGVPVDYLLEALEEYKTQVASGNSIRKHMGYYNGILSEVIESHNQGKR